MAEAISVSSAIGAEEKVLSLETGVLAGQANGSVVVTIGRTKVLATATSNKNVRPGTDFFPLTVDFEGKKLCSRENSGFFLSKRRKSKRNSNLSLPSDRQTFKTFVSRRI